VENMKQDVFAPGFTKLINICFKVSEYHTVLMYVPYKFPMSHSC